MAGECGTLPVNGYICFYNGKRMELYSHSSYAAQQSAIRFFKPPKSKEHMVHVHLAEKHGETVVHTADF